MAGKVALVAGATGLIGSRLLTLLLADDRYNKVIAVTRKPISASHAKLQNVIASADDVAAVQALAVNDVFCCLGTTIKQAGSQQAFRKVDFDFPLALAKAMHTQGASQYLLVSALGANKKSRVFYNRVKGEVEEAIAQVGFKTLHIFRPSLLLGNRKEKRAGEDVAKILNRWLKPIIPIRYRGIEDIKVANAMLAQAKRDESGVYVHESNTLHAY